MKDQVQDILKELDEGNINTKKAIKEIHSINLKYNKRVRKASKIKIIIMNENEGKNIRIPSIPFWLINSFISLGLGLGSIAAKFVDSIDEEVREILEVVNSKDLKDLIQELRKYGPFDMINIEEGNNTKIQIRVL